MVVLDTTFLVDVEDELPTALQRFDEIRGRRGPLRVPAAVWIEYLSAFPPGPRARAGRALDGLGAFEPLERGVADEAARLQHELARAGAPLAWHDLQVAATALHFHEALVTNDTAFERVPGLEVIGW